MKFLSSVVLAMPVAVSAFPFMPQPDAGMLNQVEVEQRSEAHEGPEKRSLATTITNGVGIVAGALGSIANSVDPANKRPEAGYTFQAPGPSDSRGPCPGLNLLANYGYLPRNGLVTFGQVLEATAAGFNMGTDLATVLAVFATLTDGDIATESWYLGTSPDGSGGLPRHSTVEADISPNREDFYLGCGDNHHLSSRLVAQNVKIANSTGGSLYTIPVMAQQYAANAKFSVANNPYLYYFPFPSIVSVVAYNFYPAFFSNGTYGLGGVPNYESISNIVGWQANNDGTYTYVPEKWPENWYRRSYPYGAVQALVEGFTQVYPYYPVGMPIAQINNPANLNLSTILCDAYQGINSITPLGLTGGLADASAAVAWAAGKLDAVLPGTILGCPANAVSSNYYGNANKQGGPLIAPPTPSNVKANTGNNVYNKVYFKTAPSTPQCSHTYDAPSNKRRSLSSIFGF